MTLIGRRSFVRLTIAAAITLLAAACGGGSGGGNNVSATEKDFSISLDSSTASSGSVTFDIKNEGPSLHEFVVFKTDLAEDQLPTKTESGATIVDEEGQGVQHIDEVEDINPDATEQLTVNLQPGKYVVICNLPAHYMQGMHASLTVNS
jgi:uncharacterized cupredoxin-like copper-binding protein